MEKALISKIIPSSLVDGPGNRLVIFFQGCNYHCHYCHNPETIHLCTNCSKCTLSCPTGALIFSNQKVSWQSTLCVHCDTCLSQCTHLSSPKTQLLSVAQILEEIHKAAPFIRGITVSGGECTLARNFLIPLFTEVKKLGLTTFIDSNGSYDFSSDPHLCEVTDYIMLDIKSTDTSEHQTLTGITNKIVLKNAQYLASIGKLFEIRTVIVPNLLDNHRNVKETAQLLSPYLQYYSIRYKLIGFRSHGVRSPYDLLPSPSTTLMQDLHEIIKSYGYKDIIIL